MLVLFETPAGYAIFKMLDENKLAKSENLYLDFETPEKAGKIIKLKHFYKFEDTAEALVASTAAIEGKLSKSLKKTLKNCCLDLHEQLAVADSRLGKAIKTKLELPCVNNSAIQELMRCIRSQAESLVTQVSKKEMTAMALGLAHSLSRYKLKFSPDKVDIMVIQAVCLLDELDKQLNNYIMRAREWYGWHFPELDKIVKDNYRYVKTLHALGQRENAGRCDLSEIMEEEIEVQVKEAAETSMGSEISGEDASHVQLLCVELIELSNYRKYLAEYLSNRMMALTPNLTVLVGDLVGARLIAKAGSLTNLAKQPASTLQILGAEKALFRALKSKKNTPKYGLIYHSQIIGQSSNKNKGKMSRKLAGKASLMARIDALADATIPNLGIEHRAKLERQLKMLEEGNQRRISGTAKAKAKFEKYHSKNEYAQYATSADSTLPDKKPLIEEINTENDDTHLKKKKKKKHSTGEQTEDAVEVKVEIKDEVESETPKKKKKKRSLEAQAEELGESSGTQVQVNKETPSKKKKKKKHDLDKSEESLEDSSNAQELQIKTEKKKKKRSVTSVETEDAGEASGTQAQAEPDSNNVSKKKKKKRKLESVADDSMNIGDTTAEMNVSVGAESSEADDGQKKKKKKRKKEKETTQGD